MPIRSWNIGKVKIANQLVLAPMEAVNCASFRVSCKQAGAGLIFTDMIDTKQFLAILKENDGDGEKTVRQVINPQKDEHPLVIQLGSGSPEELAHVTTIVSPYADIIDFNCGCPLGDMLGRKGGAYLLKHPDKLKKMIAAILDNTDKPVTAKIRSGWDDNSVNAVENAQLLEAAGVSAIILHARTRKQRYMARADWQLIKEVKDKINIPLIGNGDILKPSHVVTMLGQTGCDAVMIGRAAQGNPDIFSQALLTLQGKRFDERLWPEVCRSYNAFLKLYEARESRQKLSELQDHASWWVSGLAEAKTLKVNIRAAQSISELKKLFSE